MHGSVRIPLAQASQTRKGYTNDQEVHWCPGYGDYVTLSAFRAVVADLDIARGNTVVVSGIGCSLWLPYYVDCYGMHFVHGRVTVTATGVVTAREDLSVWVVMGDSNALPIGDNHLIYVMRRNVNINILLFNNHICGLTKRRYSPTSGQGKLTKSMPYGSLDVPFNPVTLALDAKVSFAVCAADSDRAQLAKVMNAAARHRGAALVEIYQNCSIFNDRAFDALKGPESANVLIRLHDGESVVFGAEGQFCVARGSDGGLWITETATTVPERIVIHDAGRRDPSQVFILAQLTGRGMIHRASVRIFRQVERPTYNDLLRTQVAEIRMGNPHDVLQAAMSGKTFWETARESIERAWPGIPFRIAGS